jgi:hypothetical protein
MIVILWNGEQLIYPLLYKLLTNPWTFQHVCSLPESFQTKYHQGTNECLHTCNRTNGQWINNRCSHFSNIKVISLKMLVSTLWLAFNWTFIHTIYMIHCDVGFLRCRKPFMFTASRFNVWIHTPEIQSRYQSNTCHYCNFY